MDFGAFSTSVASYGLPVWDEDRTLSIEGLRDWGMKCHLGEFTREEADCLATALRGGEEGGWEDDVRWTVLRMLATFKDDGTDEPALFELVLAAIRDGHFDRLNAPALCVRQIEAALLLIRPYEQLCQAIQFLFDAMRAAATDDSEAQLSSLAMTSDCAEADQGARNAASELLEALMRSTTIHPQAAADVRGIFVQTGVITLAEGILKTSDRLELLNLVLDRHGGVQQGKFDRGDRKAAWVRRDPVSASVRLTAQRYQLPRSGRHESWDQVPWHPYRTYGARRFLKASRIR